MISGTKVASGSANKDPNRSQNEIVGEREGLLSEEKNMDKE